MMPDNELSGADAVNWLLGQPDGKRFLDDALKTVSQTFGPTARVDAQVLTDNFFLEVEGQIDNDDDYQKLIDAHLALTNLPPIVSPICQRPVHSLLYGFRLVLGSHLSSPITVNDAQTIWQKDS